MSNLYSTANPEISGWMSELYRRLIETLSSSVEKKLKISKAVRCNPIKHKLTDHIEKRIFTSYDKNSKKTTPNEEILALDWEFV